MAYRNLRLSSLVVLAIATPAAACLWDYDTLEMERQRFPETLEMITGKFLRHSSEFYQWRVQDREAKMQQLPDDPALSDWYDDLAVAHSKLGNHQRAIELMLEKEQRFPGFYKTRANLGTFYIFAGRLDDAAEQIEQALQIEPNAHFGREAYQLHLIRYVQKVHPDGEIRFPLAADRDYTSGSVGFADYLRSVTKPEDQDRETTKAITGVLGMMHFAKFDSPLLLEALGDLLLDDFGADAKQLAARAYLHASYSVEDEQARKAYRKFADQSLNMQMQRGSELSLNVLETDFTKELAEGREWYETIRSDEQGWIAAGLDPEVEFSKKYYAAPRVAASGFPRWTAAAILVALVSLGSVLGLLTWRRKHRQQPAASATS